MNALELKNLTKSFPDFTLSDLNLTVPSGCILGLIGENGAGKSTTIKLILGMLKADSGSITILGSDSAQNSQLKEEIGVVLDEPGFPECVTPREVGKIMRGIYRSWDEKEYAALLKRFALPEKKKYKDFSRGMKMKLAIAVALSHHPKLLILDEATNGLDPVVRDEVVEMFSEFTRDENHSVLISSHIVSDLEKICDYIAFLHEGRLLIFEEKDILRESYGLLHCTAQELNTVAPAAIVGVRTSPYGVEAIVRRSAVSADIPLSPVSIEDLFICMSKEAR
ncbi:MAG: ABC transporter ATP-binding protein [Oscillospiraceae bacterium]|nr:ABC transporter ATP-binding protein [Oscillospiraceae bacterium]